MVYPVLIPSKGRPNSKVFYALKNSRLKFNIVVEPQDEYSYSEWAEFLIVLPENNQGLVYSRNHILSHARNIGIDWFWMVDDDIQSFHKTINKRNVQVTPSEALSIAEKAFVRNSSIAQASLEYSQFAWSQSKPYTMNSYCDVVVCINTQRTRSNKYRKRVTLKEDRDFTLQCLANGYSVMRINSASFSCPKNGSNKGGLYDDYKSGIERQSVLEMCKLWGSDICTPVTKKDGRYDVKINWRYFKK